MMDSLSWDIFVLVMGVLGDILRGILLVWLVWREVGRIIDKKIEETIEQVVEKEAGE